MAVLLTFPFLPRWKEASGFDGACGSCESGQTNTGIISDSTGGGFGNTGTGNTGTGTTGTGTGNTGTGTGNTGTGTGNTGGGTPGSTNLGTKVPWFRRTRDVSQQEGMCFKKIQVLQHFSRGKVSFHLVLQKD